METLCGDGARRNKASLRALAAVGVSVPTPTRPFPLSNSLAPSINCLPPVTTPHSSACPSLQSPIPLFSLVAFFVSHRGRHAVRHRQAAHSLNEVGGFASSYTPSPPPALKPTTPAFASPRPCRIRPLLRSPKRDPHLPLRSLTKLNSRPAHHSSCNNTTPAAPLILPASILHPMCLVTPILANHSIKYRHFVSCGRRLGALERVHWFTAISPTVDCYPHLHMSDIETQLATVIYCKR